MDCPAGYGLYFKMVSECMESRANRSLQSRNLTFSQVKVLRYLVHRPNHTATLKELEIQFHSAQSTVSGLVVRLEQKGLIVSAPCPEDRRVKRVTLTEAGERAEHGCHEDFVRIESRLTAPLNGEEQVQLLDYLQRICASLTGAEQEDEQVKTKVADESEGEETTC